MLVRTRKVELILDQAENELGITWKGSKCHVVFLDQFLTRNKNILGKQPKTWTQTPKQAVFFWGGGQNWEKMQ